MAGLHSPNSYQSNDPNSIIVEMDKSIEKAYASMEDAGFSDPQNMTLFQWCSRVEYLKDKKPKNQ